MKKTTTISIRLTTSERKQLETLAEAENRTLSNFIHTYGIRPILEKAAKEADEESPSPRLHGFRKRREG